MEWEALKLAMQHPHLVRGAFEELGDDDFTHPWLAAVRAAMAKAGGPGTARPGEAWVVAVREAASEHPDRRVASVISALAVEPLHIDREPDERFAAAHLSRLQELTCLRRITELKSKLQRTSPIDKLDEYNRMFGELVALERYRAELRERAIGGAL